MGDAVTALCAPLVPLDDAVAGLAREPGLVAWWASVSVLPEVGGTPHPAGDHRLLTVDTATMLRNKVTRQDLYRSGVSALRRMLAGLLLGELELRPTWAAAVVLPRADEDRLTDWMHAHLRLSWCAREDRGELLPDVLTALEPGLDPEREPARSALTRYEAAAGTRVPKIVGEPYRRP